MLPAPALKPPPCQLRSTVDTGTDAPVQAQHFEAEAETLKRKEEAAFSGERMHAKGRAAWTLIRQHAREADFRAREEREHADEVNQKLRDAKVNRCTYSIDKWTQRNCSQLNIASPLAPLRQAKLANSSIYSSKCDTEEEVALMVKENIQEEVVLAKERWELTRSRVLAGAVISYEVQALDSLQTCHAKPDFGSL